MDNKTKKTIQTYEKIAFDYYKTHSKIDRLKNLLNFFIKNMKGKEVLDAGCGHGRDAKYFSEHGLNVVGIDLASNFIKIAFVNVPKAKFIQMDMRKLNFPDNKFNGIWAHASFSHIPKKDALKTLRGFRRVLKPGGILYVSLRVGKGEKFDRKKFFTLYTENEFKNLLESCNFKILKMSESENKGEKWLYIFARV